MCNLDQTLNPIESIILLFFDCPTLSIRTFSKIYLNLHLSLLPSLVNSTNQLIGVGAEDLKGHVLKLRGQMVRSNRAEMEHISINVLLEQAKYELRFGEPKARKKSIFEGFQVLGCYFCHFRNACPIWKRLSR